MAYRPLSKGEQAALLIATATGLCGVAGFGYTHFSKSPDRDIAPASTPIPDEFKRFTDCKLGLCSTTELPEAVPGFIESGREVIANPNGDETVITRLKLKMTKERLNLPEGVNTYSLWIYPESEAEQRIYQQYYISGLLANEYQQFTIGALVPGGLETPNKDGTNKIGTFIIQPMVQVSKDDKLELPAPGLTAKVELPLVEED